MKKSDNIEIQKKGAGINMRGSSLHILRIVTFAIVFITFYYTAYSQKDQHTIPALSADTRKGLHIVEPPSPAAEAPWQKVRGEQISFVELLKEWGITVEAEHKNELAIENSPNLMTFSMSWVTPTKFKVAIGMKTPQNSSNERAGFSYEGEFSEDGVESSTKGDFEFLNGQKLSAGITTNKRGIGYEFGVEIQRAFVSLKSKFTNNAEAMATFAAEVSLTKLYNFCQGVLGKETASDIKIKIDPVKYIKHFIQFAPRFIDFSSRPASAAANAVMIQFNPILLIAAISDDVSLWSRQKAVVSVHQALQQEVPKGVKIHFNENLLAELMQKGNNTQQQEKLMQLGNLLENAKDPGVREKLVRNFISELKTGYQAVKQTRISQALTLISLRSLVTAAEPFNEKWNDLPARLRHPGQIARVVGYRIDKANDDILLIGEQIPGAPALSIDDLIVGVRTVWKENKTPFCSLDPDPGNIAGDQQVRVAGVPANSGFAQVMLDADYLMKRMMLNLEKVESPGYESLIELFKKKIQQQMPTGSNYNRFWFYPCPLQIGDIQLSPDGTLVLFNTNMQVLSEQMVLSHQGLIGTGKVDENADQWAASLTKALPKLESEYPEFQHLHGLFDLVLLARTWQKLQVNTSLLERLAALPYQNVKIRSSYIGLKAEVMEDHVKGGAYYLMGGVRVRTAANSSAWLVTDQPGLANVHAATGEMVTPLQGKGLVLPAGTRRQAMTLDIAAVLSLLRQDKIELATTELHKLIEADPFDPELWCLLAMIDFQKKMFDAVLADTKHALELGPDNPNIVLAASTVRFQVQYLTGHLEDALSDIGFAIQLIPDNPNINILKGDALAVLEKIPEARAAYRQALKLDSSSVLANVSLGLLQITQGWVVEAKKLIEKAQLQMKIEADVSTVKSALALAEIGVAVLGDAKAHFAASRQYAIDVLDNPASDPASRIRALTARAILALGENDWQAADDIVEQVLKLSPYNPVPLLLMINWAHESKRDDLARRYLARAEQVAPDFPAVKKYHQLLNQKP
jgi:Flp pilus assembly protein TadD